jgi:hypothetical protein
MLTDGHRASALSLYYVQRREPMYLIILRLFLRSFFKKIN